MDFCFVATAVYGDPHAPQLATFRRFRDEVLLRREEGRRFVAWYYMHGPSLATLVREHPGAIPMLRAAFDTMALWLESADWDDARKRGTFDALVQVLDATATTHSVLSADHSNTFDPTTNAQRLLQLMNPPAIHHYEELMAPSD